MIKVKVQLELEYEGEFTPEALARMLGVKGDAEEIARFIETMRPVLLIDYLRRQDPWYTTITADVMEVEPGS